MRRHFNLIVGQMQTPARGRFLNRTRMMFACKFKDLLAVYRRLIAGLIAAQSPRRSFFGREPFA
jgi:hypothetical protein